MSKTAKAVPWAKPTTTKTSPAAAYGSIELTPQAKAKLRKSQAKLNAALGIGPSPKSIEVLWAIMSGLYLYMADQPAKGIDIPDEVRDAHHEAAVDFHTAGGVMRFISQGGASPRPEGRGKITI
jgi:hypothetical protein